jgi:alpha-amylase
MTGGPSIKVGAPATATGRFEINATLSTNRFAEVSFAVKVGDGKYQPAGTDDNAPYRIFFDAGDIEPGMIKAVVNDLNGHLRSATTETVVGG